MSKFKVTVTRTDEYEIDIDNEIWTEEMIRDFGRSFYGEQDEDDLVRSISSALMKSTDSYRVGDFGYLRRISINNQPQEIPYKKDDGTLGFPMPEDKYTKGIVVKDIIVDDDYDIDVTEL